MMTQFWQTILPKLEQELSPQQFNTWIKPLKPGESKDEFVLLTGNRFIQDWVRDKFLSRIETLAEQYFGQPVTILLQVGVSNKTIDAPPISTVVPPQSKKTKTKPINRLNALCTFETLVIGKANQLARAAAIAVADNPGKAYNPLFVYGGVGLGKTHLIQAIGNHVQLHQPEAKVNYIHAEHYVSDVVKAYQHKMFDEFKRHYHSLDILLIDDIQFFSGKNRTQEEFFYAFNTLIENQKQVIITCDTYPKEITDMEERLKSRFSWGLTVSIDPPELEMRVAILLKKALMENIELDETVAFFIAKQIRSNVRELEGALKRVLAFSRFSGKPISLESTKEALKDLLAVQNRQISIENIQKTVCDFYKIKLIDLHSKKRTRVFVRPRQMAMALAKELTNMSLPEIGASFGGRDHTTVIHACHKVNDLKIEDSTFHREYNVLLQVLSS